MVDMCRGNIDPTNITIDIGSINETNHVSSALISLAAGDRPDKQISLPLRRVNKKLCQVYDSHGKVTSVFDIKSFAKFKSSSTSPAAVI